MDHDAHPPPMIGMIIGTGTNCCYFEEDAGQYGYVGRTINIECGNFNRSVPQINVDRELDFIDCAQRGAQLLEKTQAGAYIGEVGRGLLVKIFQEEAPEKMWRPHVLSAEDLCSIMNDKSSNHIVVQKVLQDKFNATMSPRHHQIIHDVACSVVGRSAMMSAVMIAGCAKKTQRIQPAMGGVTCAIDGSLYRMNPWYQEQVRAALDVIFGADISKLIHLITADDGSGKGAAVMASL
eukprot:Trichotokara_eunicae@DN4555_c0_g1_i1.p1